MNVLIDGEIVLHGTVGSGLFFDGFSSNDVIEALARVGRDADITVRINSGGGIATEGSAIYSALRAHRGNVLTVVEGVAASAASLIAMAGDKVAMQLGAVMMIHDPSGFTAGTAKDHSKSVETLEAIAESMAQIYAEKSGKTVEEARQDMLDETWLTADEAVAAGYADEIDIELPEAPPTAFNYRLYQHAPEAFVAMADANGWTKKGRPPASGQSRGNAASNLENRPMTTAPAKPGTAATETAQQIEARVRGEEQKRLADITAACTNAGKPEKAVAFYTEGKSLSDVVAALEAERVAASKPNPQAQPGAGQPTAETAQQMEARLRSEIAKRATDITAACTLVGKPEKAAAFIADSTKTVSDVIAALQTEQVAAAANGNGGGKGKKPNATGSDEVVARAGTQPSEGASEEAQAAWNTLIDKRHPKAAQPRQH